jgi:putative ABC transport system ATP-binding protein
VRDELRAHRHDVLAGSALVMTHQLCEAFVPVVIGLAVDRAIATSSVPALLRWTSVTVGLFVVLALAARAGYYRLDRATEAISHDLRCRLTERLVDPRGAAQAEQLGRTVNIATSDADRVGHAAEALGISAGAIAALGGGGLFLVAMSWQLGLVVAVGLPIVVLLAGRLAGPIEARSAREQDAMAAAAGVATDLLLGLRVLKGLGAEAAASQRYWHTSEAARVGRTHAARALGAYEGATLAIAGVFLVVVTAVGADLALDGRLTVGALIASVGLAQFLVGPLTRLAAIGPAAARANASAARVAALLDGEVAVHETTEPLDPVDLAGAPDQALALDAVVSGHLDGCELRVGRGEWLGVVAGAAAHDLLDLLARRRDPDDGVVRVGRHDVRDLALEDLRAQVMVADHHAALLGDTLEANVRDGGDLDLERVLHSTTVDEVARVLPGGAHGDIGVDGARLSGGQRQRLLLARAVASDAPILVLHDPTTAVDAATDVEITSRVHTLRERATTVVVTTDPAWLARCDRVVVLRDGRVVAEGTHAELLADHADYREVVA